MGCYNAVFTFAKRSFRIDTNPMADVKIPGKVETDVIPYGLEQVRHIVTAAQQLRIELFLSLLVQSFTGVRISEIADRHTSDIKQIEGIWCLDIPRGKRPLVSVFCPCIQQWFAICDPTSVPWHQACCFPSYLAAVAANPRCMRRGSSGSGSERIWESLTRGSNPITASGTM